MSRLIVWVFCTSAPGWEVECQLLSWEKLLGLLHAPHPQLGYRHNPGLCWGRSAENNCFSDSFYCFSDFLFYFAVIPPIKRKPGRPIKLLVWHQHMNPGSPLGVSHKNPRGVGGYESKQSHVDFSACLELFWWTVGCNKTSQYCGIKCWSAFERNANEWFSENATQIWFIKCSKKWLHTLQFIWSK